MRHVPDGKLRRLVDEPFAIADADVGHVAGCGRCRRRHQELSQEGAEAAAMLARPYPVPDLDAVWRSFTTPAPAGAARERVPVDAPRRRVVTVTLPSARAMVAAAVLVAGAATAGTLAAVESPSSPAPQRASVADFQAIEELAGIGGGAGGLGGFRTPSGERQLPFGVLRWSSSGPAHSVASLAAADAATGLQVRSPVSLPAGVGGITAVLVQPRVTATIRFGAAAGGLAGRSLTVSAGPAVVVEYGGVTGGLGLPTLATLMMDRPTVRASSSGTTELEAYVLAAPDVPTGFSEELRLLGDVGTVLPFQAPPGTNASQVDVNGAPGILVTAPTIGATGVIWMGSGFVQAAVGLLDGNDVLHVARQLG